MGGVNIYCIISKQLGRVAAEAGKDTNKEYVLSKRNGWEMGILELKGSLAEERLFLEANQI